jgi:hypothetical protein
MDLLVLVNQMISRFKEDCADVLGVNTTTPTHPRSNLFFVNSDLFPRHSTVQTLNDFNHTEGRSGRSARKP